MERQRNNSKNYTAGILLVGLGLLLFVGQFLQFNFFNLFGNWNIAYPWYVIVPGVILITIGLLGGRSLLGFTIFGSIVLVSGLVLAFQDFTQSYQTWAYLWALVFPGSIGMALTLQSFVTQDAEQRKAGLNMMLVAVVLTVVFGSFFEGAINLSGFAWREFVGYVGPVLLIAIGGWLMFRRGFFETEK